MHYSNYPWKKKKKTQLQEVLDNLFGDYCYFSEAALLQVCLEIIVTFQKHHNNV